MNYAYWLVGISLAVTALERLFPLRPRQPRLRPQLAADLFYLAFNGHFFAVWFGGLTAATALTTRDALGGVLPFAESGGGLAQLPWFVQLLGFLIVSDFLQWCIHNLLHRVPFLWQFHKVHHSIHTMDWLGNFRFHWVEVLVYRSLTFVPLALLGGSPSALFAVAVFGTFWGHLNHANVNVDLGPLGRVFNSPKMHLWHHDASDEGGRIKNLGIVLSVWDYAFGTAYWPSGRAPKRLGYAGDEDMPRALPGQLVFPLGRSARRDA